MAVKLEHDRSSQAATEPQLVIRDARPEDTDRVATLILESYAEFENDVPASVWELAKAEWSNVLGRWEEAELIVAERGGELLGTVTFYPDGTLSRTESWPPGWAAIRIFCVSPRARKRGAGSALTQECIRRARERGIATIGLKTGLFMVAARAAYEKAGFVRDREHDHYWTGNGLIHEADPATATVPALAYRMDFA